MAKVGRNQPCPCGSGKKYKQCCLANDEAAEIVVRDQQRSDVPPPSATVSRIGWLPVSDDGHPIDQLSNRIVDLIDAGQFDEAERLCQRLLDDYPDLPDGHMRFGQLFRTRGELKKAAHHLRLSAAVARAANDDPEIPLSLEDDANSLDPPRA